MKKILVAGAGGFIGGELIKHFKRKTSRSIRAVDIKPVSEWYQTNDSVEQLCLDLSQPQNCMRACEDAVEVYNLAANMGGMGFIENYRIECLRNILVNLHLLEAAYQNGTDRYFYSSSACVYNTDLQQNPNVVSLKESDAYPAKAERGYGWEKLLSEMFCEEYWHERNMKTFIARFHNVYGPYGSWNDGKEKAPAAICRKVIEAKHSGIHNISIWGDGKQTRSFQFIDDCVIGIDKIIHCDALIAKPINLGSSELVTINQLVDLAEKFADINLTRTYDLTAPKGVGGRNSDNTMIKQILGWEPSVKLEHGLHTTYKWIEQEYTHDRC